jgi:hypothetical protein
MTVMCCLQNLPANRKPGTIPEEMFQILLTNKKQGKNYRVHAAHIIKPTQFRVYLKNYV